MSRFIPALISLALLATACGVDRDADPDAVLAAEDGATDASPDASDDPAAEGDDADPAATPTTLATPPPTTAPAGDVALTAQFADGDVEITHGRLNDVVVPTTENEEFVQLAFGGARPPQFELGVLTQQLASEALLLEIAEAGAEVTDADVEAARTALLAQVASLYSTSPDPLAEAERLYDEVPYLSFLSAYQAGQDVLTAAVVDQAAPGEGNPCVRHILVETEAEADAALERLDAGEDFGAVAIELSTGPSAPAGGDLGCAPSSNYVGPFAEAVDGADLGAYVGPVETQFGFHVLVVDRYEVDGQVLASTRLRERLAEADVEVDSRLGVWDIEQLNIVPTDGP